MRFLHLLHAVEISLCRARHARSKPPPLLDHARMCARACTPRSTHLHNVGTRKDTLPTHPSGHHQARLWTNHPPIRTHTCACARAGSSVLDPPCAPPPPWTRAEAGDAGVGGCCLRLCDRGCCRCGPRHHALQVGHGGREQRGRAACARVCERACAHVCNSVYERTSMCECGGA